MHQHHGHHHGAFADPEKIAAKLNSPQRDAWQRPAEMIAALELRAGETVADIGTGTGYMVAHLSKAVGASGTVIAIDTEQAMVDYLSNRIDALGPATVKPQKGSPDAPALPDESVDAILILDTWHHIDARPDYARKLYPALKPGGRLVIVESAPDAEIGPPQEMRVAPELLKKELASAGFRTRVISESMPRHYLVVARKD